MSVHSSLSLSFCISLSHTLSLSHTHTLSLSHSQVHDVREDDIFSHGRRTALHERYVEESIYLLQVLFSVWREIFTWYTKK